MEVDLECTEHRQERATEEECGGQRCATDAALLASKKEEQQRSGRFSVTLASSPQTKPARYTGA